MRAHQRRQRVIVVGDGAALADRAEADVLRFGIAVGDISGGPPRRVRCDRAVARADRFRSHRRPQHLPANRIDGGDAGGAALGKPRQQAVAAPLERSEGHADAGGAVARLPAGERNGVDVAADRAEIAHQPADEGHGAAVRRHAREVHLHGRGGDDPHRPGQGEGPQAGDPPLIVAIALGRRADEAPAVRRPVIFVDKGADGRDQAVGTARGRHDRDPLAVFRLADQAHLAHARLGGARFLGGVFRREKAEGASVRRPARRGGQTLDAGHGAAAAAFQHVHRRGAAPARHEGQLLAVRRPGEAGIAARLARIEPPGHPPARVAQHQDRVAGGRGGFRLLRIDAGDGAAGRIERERGVAMQNGRGLGRKRGRGRQSGGKEGQEHGGGRPAWKEKGCLVQARDDAGNRLNSSAAMR